MVNGTSFPIPQEAKYQLNRIAVRTNADALRMVDSGRADMVFLSNSANQIIDHLQLKNIKQASERASTESFHIALHPRQQHLAEPISALVEQLKQQGAFAYQGADGQIFIPAQPETN